MYAPGFPEVSKKVACVQLTPLWVLPWPSVRMPLNFVTGGATALEAAATGRR